MRDGVSLQQDNEQSDVLADFGYRLLKMQQELEEWDRLYNEEMACLQRELGRLKADWVHHQALVRLARSSAASCSPKYEAQVSRSAKRRPARRTAQEQEV